MSKKIATTIYITQKQQDQLKELNERLKVPISELIRQGIDLNLKKYNENLSGQMAFFEEHSTNTQENKQENK